MPQPAAADLDLHARGAHDGARDGVSSHRHRATLLLHLHLFLDPHHLIVSRHGYGYTKSQIKCSNKSISVFIYVEIINRIFGIFASGFVSQYWDYN